jgi:hypothetical protein
MTTENPFKTGDRVVRTETGEKGTVIGAVLVTDDQYTTRRKKGKYKDVQTAAKGDWKIGVHWDWEKEMYGDEVPKVTDPQFAKYEYKQWEWHQRHKRWILARFIEKTVD